MSKLDQEPDPFDETYQIVPVQSFTCKAIRVLSGTVLPPRFGRPDRRRNGMLPGSNSNPPAPETDTPPTEPPVGKD